MFLNSYLSFNGNCREAMEFYQQCLGGELNFQTVGESPLAHKIPINMKKLILHATLKSSRLIIMGTDIGSEQGLVYGNSVSLMLNCSSLVEIEKTYETLSSGGKSIHPLEDNFWGALFGDLTDKYGIHWLLNYDRNPR